MFELNNFDSIQIGVASPEKIREWSYGEVTKPETINYRTQKPEMGGLFCERIFGPTKDWECHCGKYKRIRYKGVICDKCGVEITKSKVRRDRMGHIELAAPVSHIWYFKGVPSRIGLMLDMSPKSLEHVLYFASHVVLDPGTTPLQYKQVISDREKIEAEELYGEGSFKTGIGAEAIKELLMAIDLDKESAETKKIIEENGSGQRRIRAVKRIEIIESFRKSGNRPEWMILDVLPVIPPELRPMVQLDGGRFATSDLNDLYRRVINRNNRLKKLMDLGAPEIIIRNEKRMLQEAVDALIDNGRHGKAITGAGNRELKSLSGMLRGKQGRFRQNLLGKRVDYSGRSVIVVGPELKLYQCGLPKEMAIELFKPFVMKKLVENNICHNIKNAKRTVERAKTVVWDVLEEVIKDHPVMLNRAPTLHRLSIQAFEPVLIEGRAIKLHPLVCGAFNADFDGDQMAVHVPLSVEAQAEARFLMLASNNILKLSDGKPVMSPTQDMVMGSYYLTIIKKKIGEKYNEKGRKDENGTVYGVPEYTVSYTSPEEAIMAYQTKEIGLQDEIIVRRTVEVDGEKITGRVKTSVGKIIFNQAIPQDLGFAQRKTKEDYLKYEIDKLVGKKDLQKIVGACFKRHGASSAADVLDEIKALGFKYSTVGAITTSVFDMHMPKDKAVILKEAEEHVLKIETLYKKGYITDEERYKRVVSIWKKATDDVTDKLMDTLDEFNPILMMANSGARGSKDQIKQLAGMRGLMTDPNGKTIEIPVKSCFREGLSVLEYFISSHGGRKGLADTALKTADSGYLTRRLVDVSQEVIIKEEDCFANNGETVKGVKVSAIKGSKGEVIEGLRDRIAGRFTVKDILNPETGEVIVKANEMITEDDADFIVKLGIEEVEIRSIFTCKAKNGVCAKCYGKNMSNNNPVQIGEAVGIIAAQSIGEPGTQLTMRTFHTGGIASTGDITQGLPRVEELFEARKPKHAAIVCEHSGEVEIEEKDKIIHVIVKTDDGARQDYTIPFGTGVIVKAGDRVEPGSVLTNGSVYPQDILKTKGIKGVQDYILREIQSVYRSQGVDINDKHVEIIVRQMMKKVQVENPGGTDILPGEKLDVHKFEEETLNALENGLVPPQGKRILLGITKAALAKESFLSAASFQETARVLTEAAIKNKIDPLIGLKENVIIGKLIPAGTGIKNYKNVAPQTVISRPMVEEEQE
ncbi:MAG: DNA-directed RNA polymerase subunit beta' [Clostridia bacterium]|nr:DNA-directed RNA polymerase subunit beta' [Clostridia bacterium]